MIAQAVLVDLRARLRGGGTTVVFVLLLALMALAAVLSFRAFGVQPTPVVGFGGEGFGRPLGGDASPDPQLTLQTLTAASRGVGLLIILGGLLAVCGGLIGAAVGAATFSGEYERETLDLLLTTELGPGGLTTAKLLGTFLYGALLALAVLPTFGILVVFSVLPWRDMLIAAAVVLGSVLFGSSIGVFCSARSHSVVAAVLGAVFIALLVFAGAGALYLFVAQMNGEPRMAAQLLLIPNPVAALLSSSVNELQAPTALLLPSLLRASPDHPVSVTGSWQMPVPFWVLTLALDLLGTVLLSKLAARSLAAVR